MLFTKIYIEVNNNIFLKRNLFPRNILAFEWKKNIILCVILDDFLFKIEHVK